MPKNPKFNPRKMMERAIEVMRESIGEARDDGKPNPLVGAALLRSDGTTETACRGELREGNHAEFTLLERKCVDEKLDDCILFATLEPCLNRNHPKRGCARHIVSARIKKVYVGIEDDNPTVAGKGIQYLRNHGVEIEMFDRDLQDIILKENQEFFEWARQQTEEPEEKPIKLSEYEDALKEAKIEDFSEAALKRYRTKAKIKPEVSSAEFNRLLKLQGLVAEDAQSPSGFGYLLFGKDPRLAMPQAGLLVRAEFPNGKAERKEFSMPMVLIPGELEKWLNKILPNTLDRSQMERTEKTDLPFVMIREAVVNALIHRDYDIKGQKCQLVVTSDAITIKSPGDPIPPITMEQMRSFKAPMKSRNPVLHFVFARMGLAEEQGYGLTSLKEQAEKHGLPLPAYSKEGDSLVLTIYRNAKAATESLDHDVLDSLNSSERKGWEFMAGRIGTTQSEYARELGVTARTAQRHLTHFVELGLLRRMGSGPATEYLKP
ncbi:MAG: hypothetical protein DRQ98_12085 [Gammaproteobacteria bacterium]|nr:MAG: hypothetical protein DRQ98_12085 [Gammaproteobacteria bacterium]